MQFLPPENKKSENTPYLASSKVLPLSFLNLIYSSDFGIITRDSTEQELIEVDTNE